VATWYGLSIAPDRTVWATGSSGLVHVDPETSMAVTYTSADGLYGDAPRAVVAASDGTVWVGHLGDVLRQGEQVQVEADGSLTVLRPLAFASSGEVAYVFRLGEDADGDIWAGTNEGLCVFDASLGVFLEHMHPTHPHSYTYGLGFAADDAWNGDQYQLSRWHNGDDGSSVFDDIVEYWEPWTVGEEEPVSITDLGAYDHELWLTSSLYGVARVAVGDEVGTSVTEEMGGPSTASAVRPDGAGHAWVGTTTGLWVYDDETEAWTSWTGDWLPSDVVQQVAVDRTTDPPTVWIATPYGLVRIVGVPGGGVAG
jgi:ligand-binding sensor domain-containing protein